MPSFRSAFVFTAIALAAFTSAAPTGITPPVKDVINNTHNVAGVAGQANGNGVNDNNVKAFHHRAPPPPPVTATPFPPMTATPPPLVTTTPPPTSPVPAPASSPTIPPPKPFPRRDTPVKDIVNNTKNVAGVAGQANDNNLNVHVACSACTTCDTLHGVILNVTVDAIPCCRCY